MTDTDRLAELAAIEHEQWMTWVRSMMSADDVTIGPERLARWRSYMVPYGALPEEVQRHDKVWAQAILDGPFRSLVDDNRELRAALTRIAEWADAVDVWATNAQNVNGWVQVAALQDRLAEVKRAALHREDGA